MKVYSYLGKCLRLMEIVLKNPLSNYYKQPADLGLDTHGSQQLWWFTNQYSGKKNGSLPYCNTGEPCLPMEVKLPNFLGETEGLSSTTSHSM